MGAAPLLLEGTPGEVDHLILEIVDPLLNELARVGDRLVVDRWTEVLEKEVDHQVGLEIPDRFAVLIVKVGLKLAHENRATNVPVSISHADGKAKATLNQRKTPKHDGVFTSVGTFTFASNATVTISNANTDGYVLIDAVQLVPVK